MGNTARVAMLVENRKFEVKEYPIPEIGDNEILVKVEGCGICGTDVYEWKQDPFGLKPVVLGHEGTGEVLKLGKNVKVDTAGAALKVGDKIVTSVTRCEECGICRLHPGHTNLCDKQGVFGLITDSETHHLNGWFATHLVISGAHATYFKVNELNLNERMLLELAAVCVHALERGKTTGLINFDSKVLVQGGGPVGLMMTAVLKAAGINHVILVDGVARRLEMAKRLGAKTVINFQEVKDINDRVKIVKDLTAGQLGADFAFQCTGAPAAAADVFKYIRRGGGLCELGFFVNNGEAPINPHFDFCNKEINLVGSWDYCAEDYPKAIAFIKEAKAINIPVEELITHTYSLDDMNDAMEKNLSMEGIKISYLASLNK